jgi:hypothetical protein
MFTGSQHQSGPSLPRTEEVRRHVQALVAGLTSGRAKEVYARYYSPGTHYVEAWQREHRGTPAGEEQTRQLGDRINVHELTPVRIVVDGDTAVIEWRFLVSAKTGVRKDEPIPVRQVWCQTWRGDRIAEEAYYVT